MASSKWQTWIGVAAPDRDSDPLGHLVVRYSHPRWIVAALSESLGESPADDAAGGLAETEAVLAADSSRPRVTLCAVPGLADPAELVNEPCFTLAAGNDLAVFDQSVPGRHSGARQRNRDCTQKRSCEADGQCPMRRTGAREVRNEHVESPWLKLTFLLCLPPRCHVHIGRHSQITEQRKTYARIELFRFGPISDMGIAGHRPTILLYNQFNFPKLLGGAS